MSNEHQRKQASLNSKGSSSEVILNGLLQQLKSLPQPQQILDVGCGQGDLLNSVKKIFPNAELTGVDYTDFTGHKAFHFFQFDFNQNFDQKFGQYDLILSSEVIEHIENPRHFIRELSKVTKTNGHILLSTPNPSSLTSIISLLFRGYHSAFGPRDYPAHISPLLPFDMRNLISENEDLELLSLNYIPNGRIPGTNLNWQSLAPFVTGRLFSENYFALMKKRDH